MTSVTTFFRSVLDDLVEKRLWPVAVALVLALIAIPVLLSSSAGTSPSPGPAPATPATPGGPLSAFQPVVSTEGKKSSEIRKDLEGFETKNPFEPPNLGGGGGSAAAAGSTAPGVEPLGAPTGAGGGTVTPAGGSAGSSPPAGDTTTGSSGAASKPQTFYYAYTTDVRFGKEGNLDRKTLSQFRSLPSSQDPVVVFMGVKEDGETAIFLLSSAASSTGEGNCEPDDTCTFLYMKEGDKQRFEAVAENNEVVTYELVLLGIDVKRTTGPEKAEAASREARSKRSRRNKRSTRSIEDAKGRSNPFARGFQAIGF